MHEDRASFSQFDEAVSWAARALEMLDTIESNLPVFSRAAPQYSCFGCSRTLIGAFRLVQI